jgi:hypothetical protein
LETRRYLKGLYRPFRDLLNTVENEMIMMSITNGTFVKIAATLFWLVSSEIMKFVLKALDFSISMSYALPSILVAGFFIWAANNEEFLSWCRLYMIEDET